MRCCYARAQLLEGVCIACGSFSIKGARRVVSLNKCETITSLWKEIFSEEIEREGRVIDLDAILKGIIYMCKKCYYCYENFLDSKKVSFLALVNSTRVFCFSLQTKACKAISVMFSEESGEASMSISSELSRKRSGTHMDMAILMPARDCDCHNHWCMHLLLA